MKFAARGDLSQIFDLALGNCSGICPPELIDGMGPSWGLQLRGKRWPGGGVVEAGATHVPSRAGLRYKMGKGEYLGDRKFRFEDTEQNRCADQNRAASR